MFRAYTSSMRRPPKIFVIENLRAQTQNEMTLLNRADVAKMASVSVRTLDIWRRRDLLPTPIRVGSTGRPRWRLSDILSWLDDQRQVAAC